MLEQWKAKGLADPWQYLSIREFMDEESALMSLNMLIQWLVENQLFLPLRDFLANISVQSESMQNVVNSGRLSMALLMNKRQKIQEMIDLGQINLGAAGGQYIEESRLQLARYYQFTGDPDQALNFSKEALFGFQKTGNHRGEVFANLELALALLAQQKMGTALDYFEISRRIGNQLNQSYGLILASSLETMGIFLFGNLSLAERNVQQQLELSQREGRRDREFFLGFLQGRILFELGEYKEASQCFSQLYHRTKKFDYLDCGAASIRWQARSLIYHGKIEQGKKILNGLDQTPER
jgi:tetratricopeptide (TPR) repeat protein